MATNPPKSDNHRIGAVKGRSQTFNPYTERFVKRDKDTGQFMDMKSDKKPFKGVSKERGLSKHKHGGNVKMQSPLLSICIIGEFNGFFRR